MTSLTRITPPDKGCRRVISLDFDGVLHPARDADVPVFAWLVHLVALLTHHQDVMLLVHSSWREVYRPDEIQEMLDPMSGRFIGVAPKGERYPAICEWLQSQPTRCTLLIVDDDRTAFPSVLRTGLDLQIVHCDPATGLSSVNTQDAVAVWLEATDRRLRGV